MQSALSGGDSTASADIVVQSSHKTLSALTQAAMLHVRGPLVDRDRISRALQLLQVSPVTCTVGLSLCDTGGLFTALTTASLSVAKVKGKNWEKKKWKRKQKERLKRTAQKDGGGGQDYTFWR